ncbi:hypothetical protein [Streptomyces sp. JB150]|uniref:hypothetical protein n=1 Tax=Streptomyces sp. JB150 TaxID=2714844 RepID=UPI00140BA875|nr:hypothetical protein [Streptomyces sp. JB150]QIJ65004.1 hypothetical protein G7Z13_25490 [Streptomyces sp. JB150]
MRRLHWAIWLATGLGAAMVVGGWVMDGMGYVPGFLLEIGATLILLVPLAVLERRLHRTEQQTQELNEGLRRVDQRIHRAAEEIERLGRMSVEEGYGDREAALNTAENRGDQPSVRQVLQQAQEMGAISAGGVRVRPEGLVDARLRFRAARAAVTVRIETESGGQPTASSWQSWRPGENARRLCRRLNAEARDMGVAGPGMPHLPVEELVALVRLAVASHTGDGRDLGAVVELAGDEWVISDDGLYGRPWPYRVPRTLVIETTTNVLTQYRVRNAPLADPARLAAALELARAAYRSEPPGEQ